jgi:hypothetical protein
LTVILLLACENKLQFNIMPKDAASSKAKMNTIVLNSGWHIAKSLQKKLEKPFEQDF